MGEHRSEEGRAISSPLSGFADQWGSPRLPQAGWLPGWLFLPPPLDLGTRRRGVVWAGGAPTWQPISAGSVKHTGGSSPRSQTGVLPRQRPGDQTPQSLAAAVGRWGGGEVVPYPQTISHSSQPSPIAENKMSERGEEKGRPKGESRASLGQPRNGKREGASPQTQKRKGGGARRTRAAYGDLELKEQIDRTLGRRSRRGRNRAEKRVGGGGAGT